VRLARTLLLAAATCLVVTGAGKAKRESIGPFPDGRLEVRLQWTGPLGFCDVMLERDGLVVRQGKPDPRDGTITFEKLPPGHYDVRAVSRSFVPRDRPDSRHPHRVAVWMRNGRAAASAELRVRRKEKPEVVKLEMQWGRPVAQYLIAD